MSYKELVDLVTPKENKWKNMFLAFISGGIIGIVSEILVSIFNTTIMGIIWVVIASILTGMGVFDKLVEQYKMGVIIPTPGFAHSVTASSLEYKYEGLVTGIGSNYFKLAGSVILYGIISAFCFASIRSLICLL